MKNCKTCNEYSCGAQGTNSVSEICGKRKSDNISPICEDAEERRMTREEAIAFFKDMNECTYGNLEAVEIAIKALKQKPCEDAISREAVKAYKYHRTMYPNFEDYVDLLPPVTPQQKTGRWIKSRDCYGNNHFTCPFCENDIATKYDGIWKDNYCSNCGAKLKSEE